MWCNAVFADSAWTPSRMGRNGISYTEALIDQVTHNALKIDNKRIRPMDEELYQELCSGFSVH